MQRILASLASGLVTVFLIVTLAFVLLASLPGDKLPINDDMPLTHEERARLERIYGLDRPLHVRYWAFVSHALRGDLGISLRHHRPVTRVLADALVPTFVLSGSALVVAFAFGLAIGTRAALRPRGPAAFAVSRLLPVLDALPPFWIGLLAILFLSWKLGWFPAGHMRSPGATEFDLLDILHHLILPGLVIGLPGAAPVARHHAAALAEVWHSPAILAARALGVGERRLLARALRESLHPAIALLGLALPTLIGGVVVVEVVFAWPGLGRVHQAALLSRDIPLVLGGLLAIGVMVVLGSFLADLLSAAIDPRWRRSGESR